MLPDGLEARYRSLRRRPKERAALRAGRESAVARVAFGTKAALWIPPVPLDPPKNAPPPRPVDSPGPHDALAGLDADGSPVLVRNAFGLDGEAPRAVLAHPREESDTWVLHSRLLTWDGPRLEVVGFLTHADVSHVTWIDHDEQGRPVRFATAGVPYNALGKGAELAECAWDRERCVRVDRRTADDRGRVHEEARIGEYDEDGLVRVVRAGDGLVVWDRALHGYDADPMDEDAALEVWAAAIVAAARRAAAELPVEDPFAVAIWPTWRDEPFVAAGGAEVLRRARDREDAIARLSEPRAYLLDHLDTDGLRALRALRQRDVEIDGGDHRRTVQSMLGHAGRVEWPGGALPLVFGLGPSLEQARRAFGDARVDAAFAGVGGRPAPPPVTAPPASREEVAALLAGADLPSAIAGQAAWGLALVAGGQGESRIGGRPDLPEGTAWPAFEGRPLTHLASIALDEVPEIEGRDLLPADGRLVLLAGLQEDDELWESERVGGDPRLALLHIPAGIPLHRPDPPRHRAADLDPPALLRERRVRFSPVLTLPERPEGLPEAALGDYEELYHRLVGVTPGLVDPGHLLLGHPAVVQWDPREAGEVSLLHLGWDEEIGFEYLDGGDITIFGAAEDVRTGGWERLRISVESG